MNGEAGKGWAAICGDLKAEAAALRTLVTGRPDPSPQVTPFHGWRVRDTITHLVFVDRLAQLALRDPAAFDSELAAFGRGTSATPGRSDDSFQRISAYQNTRLDLLSWNQLLAAWEVGLSELCDAAARLADDARVRWFAGEMRATSLLNARQMEVWAYGQDVFDLWRAPRANADRLKAVAEFAVRTFSFSFANRGLDVPTERPFLDLIAPSGARWTWNAPEANSRIQGQAVDFCLVATQRRNVTDTDLRVEGEAAHTWMRIAQCIAGEPHDGPRPGERTGAPGLGLGAG